MTSSTNVASAAKGTKPRLARDIFFRFLESEGIGYFFGNPGTTELPLVDGVNDFPSITYVLALHEDIAVAMAMGYARASGRAGVVNLHVAPGLGHGLGNLYNAYRAKAPLVVTAGQHHTQLLIHEPILTADLAAMARPFTKWAYEVRRPDELQIALQRAFKEAVTPPTGPTFLSFPSDVLLAPFDTPKTVSVSHIAQAHADPDEIERAAAALAGAKNPIIIAGDGVGLAGAWTEVASVAEALGASVYTEEMSTLWNFPNEHPQFAGSMPNIAARMRDRFAGVDVALLIGFTAQAPVSRFDGEGPLIPGGVRLVGVHDNTWELGKNHPVEVGLVGDIKHNSAALAEAIGRAPTRDASAIAARTKAVRASAAERVAQIRARSETARNAGTLSATTVAAELAAVLPRRSILVDEAISNRQAFVDLVRFDDPLSYFAAKGLSLGFSVGAAIGLKLGAPDRTVVNVVGDGSLLYYPQALWSLANLKLPIVVLVVNNSSYRVLKLILRRWGGPWGDSPALPPGLELGAPNVDFVALAGSMGVDGERVAKAAELRPALERALASGRPYILDVRVEQPDSDTGGPS